MKDVVVSKRYAKALFQIAKEQNKIIVIENELVMIKKLLSEDETLEKFLNHPNIQVSTKNSLFHDIFAGKISDILLNTLSILVKSRRIDILPEFVANYIKLSNAELGQAQATIYSSHRINDTELNEIINKFSSITNKKIRAELQLDESLLGGIKVKIGDRLYDGTLSGKLNQLSKTLEQSQVL